MGGRLVHELQTSVVLEDIQDRAVCLPQKLQPWRHNGAVGSVARLLARDGGEEDGLWGLRGLEVVDVLGRGGVFDGGLDLICLGLGLGDLLLGELDEALEDELQVVSRWVSLLLEYLERAYLDGAHVGVLGGVLVLVQAVLCEFAFSEIDAELDKEDHDGLERGDGAVAGALGGDMFVEQREGSLLLLDSNEFLGAFAVRR